MPRFTVALRFSHLLLISLVIVMAGCAVKPRPAEFDTVRLGQFHNMDSVLKDDARLHIRDSEGRTLLHEAALTNHRMIEPLLEAGLDINVVDKRGMTALHLAVLKNRRAIPLLLKHNPDLAIVSTKPVRCNMNRISEKGLGVEDVIDFCKLRQARYVFQQVRSEQQAWHATQEKSTYLAYRNYLKAFPAALYREAAELKIDHILLEQEKKLEKEQPCPLSDSEYYFTQGACLDGLAHGPGEARTVEGKHVIGEFSHGVMVHGKMYAEDVLVWEGPIKDEAPHGKGVCVYDGEMEVCECYDGKRIDALFKQRLLMIKQEETLQQMQNQIAGLRSDLAQQRRSSTTDSKDPTLFDLFSNDKNKQTAAQVKVAVDLFSFLIDRARDQ